MNLILSGRGVDLDEPLRRYATEKLTRVERYFDRIIKMEVELTEERRDHHGTHHVEVTVKTPRETLRAQADADDYFAAIDKAADRIETQVKRVKSKLTEHSHRESKTAFVVPEDEEETSRIRTITQQVGKPLTPEEALLELEQRGQHFLLFTNAETMRAAVIFRRNGGFGLIDHEV